MSEKDEDRGFRRDGEEREVPEGLRELDRTLGEIHFRPRPDLAGRIAARIRHGGWAEPGGGRISRASRTALGAAAVVGMAGLIWFVGLRSGAQGPGIAPTSVTVLDRCCVDLDGGGLKDDGIRVLARADETVVEVTIYEDRDGDGGLSPGDPVRLAPGTDGRARGPLPSGTITIDLCCEDYDAGGPADDGLFLINVPPDRILLAALYEDRDGSGHASAADRIRYLQP